VLPWAARPVLVLVSVTVLACSAEMVSAAQTVRTVAGFLVAQVLDMALATGEAEA
jgi:hypothetical protein